PDHRPVPDADPLQHRAADANVAAITDDDAAGEMRARRDVRMVAYPHVVLDDRRGVEDHVLPDPRTGIHDRAREHDRRVPDRRARRDHCGAMHHGGQLEPGSGDALVQVASAIPDIYGPDPEHDRRRAERTRFREGRLITDDLDAVETRPGELRLRVDDRDDVDRAAAPC